MRLIGTRFWRDYALYEAPLTRVAAEAFAKHVPMHFV